MKRALTSMAQRMRVRVGTPMMPSWKGRSALFLNLVLGAFLLAAVCPVFGVSGSSSEGEAALWRSLQSGGHFVLLRHAIAPGVGDPPQFALGRCETQRNLSDEGRKQAEKIGARFRASGIRAARVFSSQWCRCLETAELLALGPVRELSALNSFFEHLEREAAQTQRLKDWIAGQDLARPLVLVTHQVNITALTGVYPGSGELVIVQRSNTGGISVVGTIETN